MGTNTTILTLLLLTLGFFSRAQAPTANFTAVNASGCSPLVVDFQDLSTGNPTSWFWDFGNGATSTLKNPSTTYFNPGSYTVKLTATNAAGSNTITRTAYITVYGKPVVYFKASDSTGCYPLQVQFIDSSLAATGTSNNSWFWDFGDGSQSTQQNPVHTYTQAGNFSVTLKVTNDKGCNTVISKPAYIKIPYGLQANFSSTLPPNCRPPFPVSFTNTTTGNGTFTYQWSFGDGNSSTQQSPSHIYTNTGNYTVQLIVTSSTGCVDTITKPNLFNFQNVTTSIGAPDSVCINSAALFQNTSTPVPVSSSWNFGDGTTSTLSNPIKTYTTTGTYSVLLVNNYGSCTDSVSKTIRVNPRPVAAFNTIDTFKCQPPFTVNFTNTSLNGVSWLWDFGDGTTSTAQNPAHTYTTYGSFTVKLIVTNASGCTDSLTRPNLVKITKPLINFPGLPQSGCVPYTANFTPGVVTSDVVTSYLWNFGDGNTSTAASPTHIYSTQGTYTVILTITTATGCTITDSLPQAIKVGRVPQINFSATPNPVCAFQDVQFTDLTNEADSWIWDFGDGGSSTSQNPLYSYSDTGSFDVKLTVTNNGCRQSLTKPKYIRIKPPISKFVFNANCNNRLLFNFVDSSIGATTWLWNFGDGTTSTQQNPAHSFPSFGSYTVSLTVTNDSCSHTSTQVIRVFDENPGSSVSPLVACKPATINLTATNISAPNIVSYTWHIGVGNTQTVTTPNHSTVLTNFGNYPVSLVTTDIYGCRDSVPPKMLRINGPVAGFTAVDTSGCKGLVTTFTNTSQSDGVNNIVSWQWHFGDGAVQTVANGNPIQHTYANAGTYSVLLVVTDASGCRDSLRRIDLIHATDPVASFSADTLTCPGSSVYFNNNSSAVGNYSPVWTFGDGGSSTSGNPTHAYADTGSYTVTLVITDQYGCSDTSIRPNYIKVRRPKAIIGLSDTVSSCSPFQVQITNASTFYNSYSWTINGSPSTVANPVQYFVTPGLYTIKLNITSPGGCTDSATRTVRLYDTAGTRIRYSPLNGCKPLPVNLIANSNGAMTYTWDFGDGVILNNNIDTLTHIYNDFGNFVPKLILSDASGCVIPVTGIDTIRIIGGTAKFGIDKTFFCDSGRVNFIDSTTFNDSVVLYQWDFGDGNTSTQQVPSHYYSAPGLYTVTLAIQTRAGCVDTFRKSNLVKIVESPLISIGGDSAACINEFMTHLGNFVRPDTSLVRWQWLFPNGNTSGQQFPVRQQYGTSGDLNVSAIAVNSSGCRDSATRQIRVHPLPVITLPPSITKQTGTPLLIPATYSSGVVSYNWTPPANLNCTNCPQPETITKFNTKYFVSVVDSNGCRNSNEVQVIVVCPAANIFLPNTFSPNGDGSNDQFYVRGKGLERVKTLRIFNRWGEVVFEANNFPVNDPAYGWNGRFKGNKPAADVYVYQVEVFCENSEIIRFEGNVALIQ